ncbi:hypothetical protein DRO66_02400 [Candidatus Bathyarchaeota archaeon]|nr:MAG: hypothetical protein DRO66_02400 [Candidatus Bathyarchaeota archaeon]
MRPSDYLSQEQVNCLPDGTPIIVKWWGSPLLREHRVKQTDDGPYCSDMNGDFLLRRLYLVGKETCHTKVWLKEKKVGVKACARRGCPNVMCSRYDKKHGYICGDCFADLVGMVEGVFPVNVSDFMDSEVRREPPSNNEETALKLCNTMFPIVE